MVDLKIGEKKVEEIELVIFDRDGTLIDLYHYWANMIGLRAESITQALSLSDRDKVNLMFEMGVDVANHRLRPEGPVGLKPRSIVMQGAIDYLIQKNIENALEVCTNSFEEIDQISLGQMDKFVKPINGAMELVDNLKASGCSVAIATTDNAKRCRITMEAIDKEDCFSAMVGSDSVKKGKPSPDMIDLITQNLKINKINTIMVGDAKSDVLMGLAAKVKASVGVCSGLTSREKLEELTEYIIKDVSEIKVF